MSTECCNIVKAPLPPHSCDVCESPQYKHAEEIIKHSGLQPEKWGYLLHEMAEALIQARRKHAQHVA